MVVYMLAVVAFGLFGCCYTFVGIVLVVAVFGRKNDLERAGYDWNAGSGGEDSYSAAVEGVADVVVAAVKNYVGNMMTKQMMDYLTN